MTMISSSSSPGTSVYRPNIPHLPSFPYEVHYDHFRGIRYAFIVEVSPTAWDTQTGEKVSETQVKKEGNNVAEELILCLHGEPTWSYLYRKMIPGFLQAPPAPRQPSSSSPRFIKRRLLAPDFLGFGRSDKPTEESFYTWEMHRSFLVNFVQKHIISPSSCDWIKERARVILVVQDWGGILGLLLPSLFPFTFTHMIVMNTALGLGVEPTKGWLAFRDFIARSPNVDVGALLKRGTPLSEEEVAAYRAPFQGGDEKAKIGVRRFPPIVPIRPWQEGVAESHAALSYYQNLCPVVQSDASGGGEQRKTLQVFVCVGEADPVLGLDVMRQLSNAAWGPRMGYWWSTIPEAGHFVQEWASHIPQLADRAWSSQEEAVEFAEGEGNQTKKWKAVWCRAKLTSEGTARL